MNHPARFNDDILAAIASLLPKEGLVLDPFAGTGRIHELATDRLRTVGFEIEPEWAALHPDTECRDSTRMSDVPDGLYDAVATSPVYGNRMSDHYKAKDSSRRFTYRSSLGRDLHENNAGRYQWGAVYVNLHEQVWRQCVRVLKPGGIFVLNVKDHIRQAQVVRVSEWHVGFLEAQGLELFTFMMVPSKGTGMGSNRHVRVDHEMVYGFKK